MSSIPFSAFFKGSGAEMLSKLIALFRMLVFITLFTVLQSIALLLLPLTFLNPILRQSGVPEALMPMNVLLPLLARGVLMFAGISLDIVDESTAERTKVIYMYNHTSNLDPVIVQAVVPCKFVYKKELKYIPLFGWVLYLYRNISIDRKKRDKAIESLNRAVRNIVEKQQNVAISPEGTRSKTGELQNFKKGPFHLAVQAKACIVPVVITGAHKILPPKSVFLQGGHVSVKLLSPIKTTGEENVDELRERVRGLFVRELSSSHNFNKQPSSFPIIILGLIFVMGFFFVS